ncbi:hypothetical protein IGB42_00791 [Andreprevotia sp. IGB-42]|uniref:hypothetical protein n=1 Tax=Andreprevotia sp. IGB-42 TaxID=2497473 RepID=UPI00135B9288|nr:hypothetical protein [Andreprevotia sp. IGB-42]KAF0814736.1 hypothetical protein IGB42_00791 [Andreprevotia sp. IGB-42]
MPHSPLAIDLHLHQLRRSLVAATQHGVDAALSMLTQARAQQYGHGIAEAQLVQAQALWAAMRYDEGLRVVRQAQQAARFEGAQDLQAEAHHTAALLYMAKGRYLQAFSAWQQALELSLITRQDELGIDALIGVGKLWHIDGQSERAHDYHLLAYQRACQLKLALHASKAAICLARQRIMLGNHEQALDTLSEASALLQADGDKTWQAEVHNYRSTALLALGDAPAALAECGNAWCIVGNDDALAWAQTLTLLQRARVLLAARNADAAATDLDAARALATRFELGDFLAQIALCWSELAEAQADWPRALDEYKHYLAHEQHALTQHRKAEQQALSSARFSKLARNMDKLVSRMLGGLAHAPEKRDASPIVSRHAWQRQLTRTAQAPHAMGIMLIQWPSAGSPRHEQQRLLLLASFCSDQEVVTTLADGLYALLLCPAQPAVLAQLGTALRAIGARLPWEPAPMLIGHAYGERGMTADFLLSAAHQALASDRVVFT